MNHKLFISNIQNADPILFTLMGFPGTGKTHFAERFSKDIQAFHLNSDRVRSEIFDRPSYSLEEHRIVFRMMDYLTEELLQLGNHVVYDANRTLRQYRNKTAKIAQKLDAEYVLLHFDAPVNLALERIKTRTIKVTGIRKKYYTKIDPEVLYRIRNNTEPPSQHEPTIYIDGTATYPAQIETVWEKLKTRLSDNRTFE